MNHFADIGEIRRDGEGQDLPNARMITRRIATSKKISSARISAFLAAFGQFVDHDLAETPIFKSESGGQLDCCKVFPLEKVNSKLYFFTKDLQYIH